MRISNQIKTYMILFALTMQFCLQGMTQNQTRGLAVLAGGCSAAFVARHSDDSRAVLGALALPSAYAYYYLQRYTSGSILGQMEKSVVCMTEDPLASKYQSNFTLKHCDDKTFVKKISSCTLYQKEILTKHPLIVAMERLDGFQKITLEMQKQLVKIVESAEKDGLKEKWSTLDRQIAEYNENISKAMGRIIDLPKYQEVKQQHAQDQNINEQRKVNQQNADTEKKKVELKEKEVNATQQNAKTFRSLVNLEWIKFLIKRLFGYKD